MRNPLLPLVYDTLMAGSEAAGLARCRAELLAGARGRVLEVGAGTGVNLAHYPSEVCELVMAEPDPGMVRRLRRAARAAGHPVQIVRADARRLPFADGSFDEAVVTLVLCSVGDPVAAARSLRRVLRPGGTLRFIEHVAATPRGPSRMQRVAQPFHRACGGGCRLDHSMVATLHASAFRVEWIRDWRLPAPRWVRPAVVGAAQAPG